MVSLIMLVLNQFPSPQMVILAYKFVPAATLIFHHSAPYVKM